MKAQDNNMQRPANLKWITFKTSPIQITKYSIQAKSKRVPFKFFFLFTQQSKVNLEQLKDDEEMEIAKRFDTQKKEGKGLGGIEVQSEQYQSEMLEFEMEDNEECDETTEEDLLYMKDISTTFSLTVSLRLLIPFLGNAQTIFH